VSKETISHYIITKCIPQRPSTVAHTRIKCASKLISLNISFQMGMLKFSYNLYLLRTCVQQ